jgi:hypothetical protein
MKPVAIFLYDFTGFMAQPWLDSGYECWLFDGQHEPGITREGDLFKVGMWFHHDQIERHAYDIARMVGRKAAFVFGFPECTQLTVAGAKHFQRKREANPRFQEEALALAMLIPEVALACDCECWAFENPVGVISTMWRKPDFAFDPADYGGYLPEDDEHPLYPDIYPPRDAYNKNTCIWCGPGFRVPRMDRIEPRHKANPGWAKCGGKSLRTKNIRSATPRGFTIATHQANSGANSTQAAPRARRLRCRR